MTVLRIQILDDLLSLSDQWPLRGGPCCGNPRCSRTPDNPWYVANSSRPMTCDGPVPISATHTWPGGGEILVVHTSPPNTGAVLGSSKLLTDECQAGQYPLCGAFSNTGPFFLVPCHSDREMGAQSLGWSLGFSHGSHTPHRGVV